MKSINEQILTSDFDQDIISTDHNKGISLQASQSIEDSL